MLDGNGLAVRQSVFDAALEELAAASLRPLIVRRRISSEAVRSAADEIAPVVQRDVVRLVAAVAIGLNIALALIDVCRLLFLNVPPDAVRAAFIAASFTIPLHVRHVIFGLRGERPPAGLWTLGLLVVVHVVALRMVGQIWIFQFAALSVSVLIVVPNVSGVIAVAGILASPLLLVGTQWFGPPPPLPGIDPLPPDTGFYLAFALIWRTVTQIVPLRLLATIRALDTAGRELESRVVVQARVRIDGELRTSVAGALQNIIVRAEAAQGAATTSADLAASELHGLTGESRRALGDARRLVARYRGSSSRAEVDAVLRDWGAAGRE